MKNLIVLIIVSLLVLSACSSSSSKQGSSISKNSSTASVSSTDTSSTDTSSTDTSSSSTDYSGSSNSNHQVLTTIGQKTQTNNGLLTLLKINTINKGFDKNGLTIHIKDAKVFKLTNISDDFKSALQSDGHTVGNDFYYLQLQYEVTNPFDHNLTWQGFTNLVTDSGEQIDVFENDLVGGMNPTNSTLISKSTQKNNIFDVPVDKGIRYFRLIPDQVTDDSGSNFHSNEGVKEIKITF